MNTSANPLLQELATMVTVHPCQGGYHAVLTVLPTLSVLKDHFAHHPILPGVCMVQVALYGAATILNKPELRLMQIKNAKMVYPVSPGDVVDFHGQIQPVFAEASTAGEPDSWQIKTRLSMGDRRVAELSLLAR